MYTAFGIEQLKFVFTTHIHFSDYMFTQNLISEKKQAIEIRQITIILQLDLVSANFI